VVTPVDPDDIGKLLVLLHDADRLLVSFTGVFRDLWRPSPSSSLIVEVDDRRGKHRVRGGGPFPRAFEIRQRIWFKAPARMRVEITSGSQMVRLLVRDDANWWRWDRVRGTDRGSAADRDGAQTLPPLLDPPMLSPARMLDSLRWKPGGAGMRLGRTILLARAEPRRPAAIPPQLSVEFEVDAEYGTVLRRAVFEKGTCIHLTEAIEVHFDPVIEPERFIFDVPVDG
jgi:hypothetical protein